MHRQDGRQEIDRRTLLAKGAAFAALLVTGCARKESRGFAATSLRQLRASDESDHDFVRSSGSGPPVLLLQSSARAGRAEVLLNLCERNHHHHWIDRTLVKSGTCIEALRVV